MSPNEFQTAMSSGSRKVGALVYWRDLGEVRIARDVFRTGFRAVGLGKALARDPKPEALLNQAAGRAARRQGRDVQPAKVELKSKGREAVYAVLMRRDEADGRAKYIEEALITIRRQDAAGNVDPVAHLSPGVGPDDQRDELIARTLEEYAELRDYAMKQEMSETLMRAMGCLTALSLRTGVYMVTEENMATVRRLKAFVDQHTSASITCWDIHASDENEAEARKDAREAFMDRLTALTAKVREFTDTVTDPDDVNAKSLNANIRKFRDLDGEVQIWASILGEHHDALRAAIADAKQSLLGDFLGDADDGAADAEDEAA